MANETADMGRLIMDLREKTGAGMMDCKKALAEANGNVEAAMVALRKKGMADAAKKSTRVTKEGAIAFARAGSAGALIELNCETDFVAKVDDFQKLASALAQKAAAGEVSKPEDAAAFIQPVFEKLGENLALRRLQRYEPAGPGLIAGYVHLQGLPSGGKKGAMIELSAPSAQAAQSPELAALAQELLLQIVGSLPKYLDRSAVPPAEVEKEKEIHTEILRKEGKPEAAVAKILEGKLNKLFFQAYCLLDQVSVRDPKTTVAALIEQAGAKLGGKIAVKRFARYQLGE